MPSAAVGGEVGRESGDAFEEVLGADLEIEDHRFGTARDPPHTFALLPETETSDRAPSR